MDEFPFKDPRETLKEFANIFKDELAQVLVGDAGFIAAHLRGPRHRSDHLLAGTELRALDPD